MKNFYNKVMEISGRLTPVSGLVNGIVMGTIMTVQTVNELKKEAANYVELDQ